MNAPEDVAGRGVTDTSPNPEIIGGAYFLPASANDDRWRCTDCNPTQPDGWCWTPHMHGAIIRCDDCRRALGNAPDCNVCHHPATPEQPTFYYFNRGDQHSDCFKANYRDEHPLSH